MFEFEKQKQLGLSQMCNSEDLDVSFAISFILCVQRKRITDLHLSYTEQCLPQFITVEEAHASPLPLQQS